MVIWMLFGINLDGMILHDKQGLLYSLFIMDNYYN